MCFSGHTHVPALLAIGRDGGVTRLPARRVRLGDDAFYFVNPGSVGHPRGADYRAQYATFDVPTRTVQFHRVRYDVRKVARENARHDVETDLGNPVLSRYRRQVAFTVRRAINRALRNGRE